MRLRLNHGHYIGSRPNTEHVWEAGEERDVATEDAAYLLDTFPGKFSVASPPVVASPVAEPDEDRAIKSPPRRR